MHWSEFDGVIFVEGQLPCADIIGHTKCRLHGIFSQVQLKNLNDVKRRLACNVKSKGGNSLMNFKYGQKSSFWTTLISVDNVNWYGEGDIARISHGELEKLRQK
jgi:hypothetical protein